MQNVINDIYSPFKLMELDPADSKWKMNVETESLFRRMPGDRPLKVVAVAGPMRSGKSFLMNRLAGSQKGFDVGPFVESCTKGIWGWLVPRSPEETEFDILLLDTEGMYDPERQNPVLDQQLFVAAILLSSLVVYNTKGVIDSMALTQLSFVTQLSKRIQATQTSTAVENVQAFQACFPALLWAVRDFGLDLTKHDNNPTTYLLNTLKPLANDFTEETGAQNNIRSAISRFFSSLHCCVIPHPGESVQRIDEVPYDSLPLKFRQHCELCVRDVFRVAKPKRIVDPRDPSNAASSVAVTPITLFESGVLLCESFNSGAVPKLDSMWEAASRRL